MALRGTLKDFGVADVFQLIGHQGKTGVLITRNRAQKVSIKFYNGNVMRAEASARHRQDLLGNVLVRAEVITEEQLAAALEAQRKTSQRLGDILIERGALDAPTLRSFTRLQTTETIHQLFLWAGGTYEFVAGDDVKPEHPDDLIRSETLLMEGFRQVDEWPAIRKKIAGYAMRFRVQEDLDKLTAHSSSQPTSPGIGDEFGLDNAFGDFEINPSRTDVRLRHIGPNERMVHSIVRADRDVQKIIDLSRMGEFETCKALANLLDAGILVPVDGSGGRRPSAVATVGGISARPARSTSLFAVMIPVVLACLLVGGVWWATRRFNIPWTDLVLQRRPMQYLDLSVQGQVAQGQEQYVKRALSVYRAVFGQYPERLEDLVTEGLLRGHDLAYPWQKNYHYRRVGDGFELRRPLF